MIHSVETPVGPLSAFLLPSTTPGLHGLHMGSLTLSGLTPSTGGCSFVHLQVRGGTLSHLFHARPRLQSLILALTLHTPATFCAYTSRVHFSVFLLLFQTLSHKLLVTNDGKEREQVKIFLLSWTPRNSKLLSQPTFSN